MTCLECPRRVQARGLCNTHYSAARRAWLEDGVDLFPARGERSRAIRLRPVTCRYWACVREVYLHGVCVDHLVDTLAAGRRSSLSVPARSASAASHGPPRTPRIARLIRSPEGATP